MRLARFSTGGAPRVGIVGPAGIVDPGRRLPGFPDDMIALIADWERWRAPLAELEGMAADHRAEEVALHAPVPRPGKIMGIGLNYADHIAESKMTAPTEQLWFTKAVTAVNGPTGTIELPRASNQLDYEAELVVVVGSGGRHIGRDRAAAAIFGYCVGNDVSVRDWQMRTSQFAIGKSFDTHAPFGPWIVTADGFDPHAADICCFVNGERRQSSNTRHMIFDCFDQVALLSRAMTMEPGDLLFTGTPGGVGMAMDPPQWLKAGDVVRIEIDGIGAIEHIVRPEGG
jgi:2-keto-4-pentenoate hydratase/2-oxohepta-3-ene-1,7-dioic acid hydratase in catechol pathway